MGHTYTSSLFHVVFSTKDRRKTLDDSIRERVWAYMGELPGRTDCRRWPSAGRTITFTFSWDCPQALSKAVQLIKGGSSKWIHETLADRGSFAWQEGYGAFSIGASAIEHTVAYIESQAEHHRTKSFEEEYVSFLQRHGMKYAPAHVYG